MFELNFENLFTHSAVCGLQIDSTRKLTSPTTTSVLFDRIKAGLGFVKFTERTNVTAPPEKRWNLEETERQHNDWQRMWFNNAGVAFQNDIFLIWGHCGLADYLCGRPSSKEPLNFIAVLKVNQGFFHPFNNLNLRIWSRASFTLKKNKFKAPISDTPTQTIRHRLNRSLKRNMRSFFFCFVFHLKD